MNFKVLAKNAVEYAKRDGIVLDWTRESVLCVEKILIRYRAKYSGQTDAKWKLSSFSACYATYIGELMLQKGLKKRGFKKGNLPRDSKFTRPEKRRGRNTALDRSAKDCI